MISDTFTATLTRHALSGIGAALVAGGYAACGDGGGAAVTPDTLGGMIGGGVMWAASLVLSRLEKTRRG